MSKISYSILLAIGVLASTLQGAILSAAYAGPGNATDTRTVQCKDDLGIPVDDSLCAGAGTKPATTQTGADCTAQGTCPERQYVSGGCDGGQVVKYTRVSSETIGDPYVAERDIEPYINQPGFCVEVYPQQLAGWGGYAYQDYEIKINATPGARSNGATRTVDRTAMASVIATCGPGASNRCLAGQASPVGNNNGMTYWTCQQAPSCALPVFCSGSD